jgi:predicted ATPase
MNSLDAECYLLNMKLLREKILNYDTYPFNLDVIRNLDTIEFHPKLTYIVGENGSGKSTLLEAIATAWGFNPEGGTKNFNFSTRASHSQLHKYIRLAKSFRRSKDGFFLRAESFYNVATNIDELDEAPSFGPPIKDSYGGKSLHKQSHGESFFSLIINRLGGDGFYILDEPEAALSPNRQLAMLSRIHHLIQKKSQFIIATHSPILLAYPEAKILQIENEKINLVSYQETENYLTTKSFINNPNAFIKKLIN